MLELWGIWSTSSLPSLPGPFQPRVVAPARVLSMGQIELNLVIMLNWIVWNWLLVFTNGLGDLGSISRSSHTKDSKKWYLMPPCLTFSIIRYRSRVKWRNPGKGVVPSPTLWCRSYRKRSLWVTLDNGRQLYFYLYLTGCLNCVFMLNWIVWNRTVLIFNCM